MENNLIVRNQDILNLNKKELKALGLLQAEEIMEAGFHSATDLLVASKKLMEYATAFNTGLKESALVELSRDSQGLVVHGAKVATGFTGDRIDYDQDPVYANLKKQLTARAELLKLAQKQNIADTDTGEQIPKVGIKTFGVSVVKVTL